MRGWTRLRDAVGADAVALTAQAAELEAAGVTQVGPQTWTDAHDRLQAIVWHDLAGTPEPLSRAVCMGIPAVARLRHILCGTVARCPLRVLDGDQLVPAQPRWTHRTDGRVHPYHRMLWTVDDHLFYGWSLWETTRAPNGDLLAGDRVAPERWDIDEAGRIELDGELADDDAVLAIPGPHEGIVNSAPAALTRVIDNLDAAANAARNPSAYLELHYTGDDPMTDTEIDAHIARWAAARRGDNGGVAWTNKVLELREHGTHEAHLLIEGRNADAVDVARLLSAPAAMADATNAGASLTYETTEGRNGQLLDYGVRLYMDSIAARLSMDDVVAPGQRTAFDTAQLEAIAPAATGPVVED